MLVQFSPEHSCCPHLSLRPKTGYGQISLPLEAFAHLSPLPGRLSPLTPLCAELASSHPLYLCINVTSSEMLPSPL